MAHCVHLFTVFQISQNAFAITRVATVGKSLRSNELYNQLNGCHQRDGHSWAGGIKTSFAPKCRNDAPPTSWIASQFTDTPDVAQFRYSVQHLTCTRCVNHLGKRFRCVCRRVPVNTLAFERLVVSRNPGVKSCQVFEL